MKGFYKQVDIELTEGGSKLPIVEEFYSVQGEGFNTGKPAYFIRIGGCDIACHWCDSKISWNALQHKLMSVDEIIEKVLQTKAKSVVVTGGEPTMYPLSLLSDAIRKNNIDNFLETSGAYHISGKWDWICVSPKKNKPPLIENVKIANELKVVVYDDSCFTWAEKWKPYTSENCKLYLQPEYSKFKIMSPKIVEYVKDNPEWNISVQQHKFLNIL